MFAVEMTGSDRRERRFWRQLLRLLQFYLTEISMTNMPKPTPVCFVMVRGQPSPLVSLAQRSSFHLMRSPLGRICPQG
jgi:hypothetical protein